MTLLIRGGHVLGGETGRFALDDVLIENGRISAVSPRLAAPADAEILEAAGFLIVPGFANAHTHAHNNLLRGLAGRWTLEELGLLGPRFVGAHGVWLTPDDIKRLGAAGAAIAHNPASNLRLGSGIAAVCELLDAGVTVGLGTDGAMSSDNLNLFEAMRVAALVGNVRFPHDSARWLEATEVWALATRGSARLLGLGDDLGVIAPGRLADVVLLRADSTFLRPLNDAMGALVYAETGADVDTILVGGRVVVRGGRVLTVDEERLRARGQAAADRIRAANADAWRLAEELSPFVADTCRAAVAAPYPINRYAAPAG